MGSYANIDHDNQLVVINIDPADSQHHVVDDLGHVAAHSQTEARREATTMLRSNGYEVRGGWRTNTDGEDIRTLGGR